jgi:hypothetical protein
MRTIILFDHCHFAVQSTACPFDVTHVCKPKANISSDALLHGE